MNIINMLKNVAFMVDPGPDENSALWKMLDAYQTAVENGEDTTDVCTLENVLKASDVLSFLQHNHQPLINFLTEKNNLRKLLEYITSCPESETLCSQRSCKILCHNFASVREAVFVDATENLDILFGFDDEDQLISEKLKALDAMHSGLLTQVVQKFLTTHAWYLVDYFSTKDGFKQHPEQLLSSPGLLQTLVDTHHCYSGSALAQWMEGLNFVKMLVDTFKGDRGVPAISCASDTLQDMIESTSPLLPQLLSRTVIESLLEDAFNSENPCSQEARMQVITLCGVLVRNESEPCHEIPNSIEPIFNHLETLNAILSPSEDAQPMTNTTGSLVPFGMHRMKVVELYSALLSLKCPAINEKLVEKEVFKELLKSFFLYKWNNILQTCIMSMFQLVFSSEKEFCKQVLEQTDMVVKVSKLHLEDLKKERRTGDVSPYRGFFRSLEASFETLSSYPQLSSIFDCPEWDKLLDYISLDGEEPEEMEDVDAPAETETTDNTKEEETAVEETAPAVTNTVVEKNTESLPDSSETSSEAEEIQKEETMEEKDNEESKEQPESCEEEKETVTPTEESNEIQEEST
mmetsp:Transcript_2858/g.4684  ORF Transcript_2858/g.4684 Transcript_2858/m.4684 type:complete len:576 (-) Transcript_2858:156-1883(-)